MSKRHEPVRCVICGRDRPHSQTTTTGLVRPSLAERLEARAGAAWSPGARVCRSCLNEERTTYLVSQLELERGELSAIEAEVSRNAARHTATALSPEPASITRGVYINDVYVNAATD
jgi:hypothetical protein